MDERKRLDQQDLLQQWVCEQLNFLYEKAMIETKGNHHLSCELQNIVAMKMCDPEIEGKPDLTLGIESFKGYLAQCIHREHLMVLRAQERGYTDKPIGFITESKVFASQKPATVNSVATARTEVDALTRRIGKEHMKVLMLEALGYTNTEIGAMYGGTRSKGKNMLATARRHAHKARPDLVGNM